METLEALQNFVLIKQDDNQEERYNNIVVADMGKEKPLQGIVLSVGPGTYSVTGDFISTKIKIGEKVVFPAFGGTKITFKGEEYVMCRETDIMATIKEDNKINLKHLEKDKVKELLEDTKEKIKSYEKENLEKEMESDITNLINKKI